MADAGNAQQQAQTKKRQKTRQIQWRSDVSTLLATAAGRRVLWWVLEQCQIYGSVQSSDATVLARFLGRRDVGLALLLELEAVEPFVLARLKQDAQMAAQVDQTVTATTDEGVHDDGLTRD